MASIEGFLDYFDAELARHPAMRVLLRNLQPRSRRSFEPSNVLLWLLVALLHIGLFVALDFAMRPSTIAPYAVEAPLQATIIRLVETAKPRVIVPPDVHRPSHPQDALPSADHALQAISIPRRVVTQTPLKPISIESQPALVLYDRDGQVRLSAQAIPKPSDPFARRAAANMLPGGDRAFASGIRLREQGSPKKLVDGVIGFLFHPPAAESCSHYEERVLNADNEKERDEDLDRYEHACM